MSRCIITISYTGLTAGGGVPKFNRDLHSAFTDRECKHFCWDDHPWSSEIDARGETEWGRARLLNEYLVKSKLVTTDDVVIADGFWAAGLEHIPHAISHSHGIWSHLTNDDVLAGKGPDMPMHHAAQVAFRTRWTNLNKPLTAVSEFIAEQMKLQWGFESHVINNGVDTEIFKPAEYRSSYANRTLVIHGVNDKGNINKGWDHIELLEKSLDADVLSLDEAYQSFGFRSDKPWRKHEVLAQADLVVHPSGYEGNSMFAAEALSSGCPFVGYDVGFAYWLSNNVNYKSRIGAIIPRAARSPDTTLMYTKTVLDDKEQELMRTNAREIAHKFLSIESFRANWQNYISSIE